MRVEACCQALLEQFLPEIDPQRQGVCIDVGVGTFAFYCELFAKLGFPAIAVEPLPTDKLRTICQQYPIQLMEQCLSDRVGHQPLHLGQFAKVANPNFSSLAADWFGASAQTRLVPTLDLATLLNQVHTTQITAFKLDIEGWEPVVIQQFATLPTSLLPQIVMFEYGGGGRRQKGQKGWSSKFLTGTLNCLQTLQQQGYGCTIMVDYAPGTGPKVFDLQSCDLQQDPPFYPNGVYGNFLCFYQHQVAADLVHQRCLPYGGGLANWLINRLVS